MTSTHPDTGLGTRETHLPLNECFGKTYQGEGPYAGRVASFIRLGHCNLKCQFCDTPWTWDRERYDLTHENPETPVDTIIDDITSRNAPITVITGGEPLMHQTRPAFHTMLVGLTSLSDVHIETNGTISPRETTLVTHYTVSPKLTNNEADPQSRRIKPRALAAFRTLAVSGRACFKFVVNTPDDLTEIDTLVSDHDLPCDTVWIMPEGTSVDSMNEHHQKIADHSLGRGYNTTTRLHVLLWPGQERGR